MTNSFGKKRDSAGGGDGVAMVIADASAGDPMPFDFGRKPVNSVDDYERLRRVRRYVWGLGWRWKGDRRALAKRLGLSFVTFERWRTGWNDVERPIPLAYLQAIGADFEILKKAVGLDQTDFDRALLLAGFPTTYTIKILPGVFVLKPLPAGITELEAIEFLRGSDWHRRSGKRCYINWAGLKLVTLWENGRTTAQVFRPELRIVGPGADRRSFRLRRIPRSAGTVVDFGDDGRGGCTTRIG